FSPKKIVITGYLGMALFFGLSAFTKNLTIIYGCIFFGALCLAVGYAYIITLFSKAVKQSRQGWVMGVTTALFAFGAGLVTLLLGLMTTLGGVFAPIAITAILVCLGVSIIASYQPNTVAI